MALSQKRQNEIVVLATAGVPPDTPEEFWDDDKELEKRIRAADRRRNKWLKSERTSAELQFFAENWTWDGGGAKPLQLLIVNPKCDAGTMLYLFWCGCAEDYYFQYRTVGEIDWDHDREIFRLLRQIERKITSRNYASARIYFDPTPRISMAERRDEVARQIPDLMYRPIGPEPKK